MKMYDDGIKISLLSPKNGTDVIRLVWDIWHKSRTKIYEIMPEFNIIDAKKLFEELLSVDLPLHECISLVFLMENVPVYFREQMVRHRIMSKAGENFGVDTIPDLADSTWWSQSMRMINMGNFSDNKNYYIPEELKDNQVYKQAMISAQAYYNRLVNEDGIPLELARGVLPFACNHTITWSMNLAIFRQIATIRSCWILQTGLWAPIIVKMINEINKLFIDSANIAILPPCFQNGKFNSCKFATENDRRLKRFDKIAPCPLNSFEIAECTTIYEIIEYMKFIGAEIDNNEREHIVNDFNKKASIYKELWKCDLYTGKRNDNNSN